MKSAINHQQLSINQQRSFSLVELIVVILVAGIGIAGVVFVFGELSRRSVYDEVMTTAVLLAEGELERAQGKNFADIQDENRDNPASFTGNFSNYSWQIRIDSVPPALADDPGMSEYKQIESRVTNSIIGQVSLFTIAVNN